MLLKQIIPILFALSRPFPHRFFGGGSKRPDNDIGKCELGAHVEGRLTTGLLAKGGISHPYPFNLRSPCHPEIPIQNGRRR